MNNNTREDLKKFIEAVENLATAVSSFAGSHAVKWIYDAGHQLKKQLDKDETILP